MSDPPRYPPPPFRYPVPPMYPYNPEKIKMPIPPMPPNQNLTKGEGNS